MEKKLLTVEIPQEVLDSAVYPIRHAAGLTFGCDPAFPGSTVATVTINKFRGVFATPGNAGDANSISAHCSISTADMKGVLVLSADKTIVNNGVGDKVDVGSSYAWITSPFSTNPSISTVEYVVGIIVFNTLHLHNDTGTEDDSWYDNSNNFGCPTDPTDGSTLSGIRYSIYCTYEVVGQEYTESVIVKLQSKYNSLSIEEYQLLKILQTLDKKEL